VKIRSKLAMCVIGTRTATMFLRDHFKSHHRYTQSRGGRNRAGDLSISDSRPVLCRRRENSCVIVNESREAKGEI